MKRHRRLNTSASLLALSVAILAGGQAQAQSNQDSSTVDEIVVTGIRASLERAMDIKRNNSGVVDAISAEDIGKFPDTNLAESLQRVPGVSIDRSNGEGSQVTVRGFGGGFNLVTLNGRTMPTANVSTVGGDQSADFQTGTSRSFDFSNLASEGVSTLEVYKTGRAGIPSGGIGATINVKTRRPLDARESGLSGSIGAKAVYDTGMDEKLEDAAKITPEVSGLLNWTDAEEKFGVMLFGSYQKRNFTSRSVTSNDWNIRTYSDFLNPSNGFVRNGGATQITNAPANGSTLVAIPNDSRYHFSQGNRERINGQATVQWRPVENLLITADGLYAQNKSFERRNDQTNWFNRPFDKVTFDNNPTVATAVFLQETLSGTKDTGFEQQYRANKDEAAVVRPERRLGRQRPLQDLSGRSRLQGVERSRRAERHQLDLGQHRRADHLVALGGLQRQGPGPGRDDQRRAAARRRQRRAQHRRPGQPGGAHLGPEPGPEDQGIPRRRVL
jgi:TonB-dependent receptor